MPGACGASGPARARRGWRPLRRRYGTCRRSAPPSDGFARAPAAPRVPPAPERTEMKKAGRGPAFLWRSSGLLLVVFLRGLLGGLFRPGLLGLGLVRLHRLLFHAVALLLLRDGIHARDREHGREQHRKKLLHRHPLPLEWV